MIYETVKVSDLIQFDRRDIRPAAIEKLKERIEKGFNPARPLTCVQTEAGLLVADGNHRLTVLIEMGIEEVPIVIREGNEYRLAIECNEDEETFAPEDLFDTLDTISKLKEDGMTQAKIGEVLGIAENYIKSYSALKKNIVAHIIDLCKQHQRGRATSLVANATFNFTEGFFRKSGLYPLNEFYQSRAVNEFIKDKFKWPNGLTAKYLLWQEMESYASEALHDKEDLPELIGMIRNGNFRSMQELVTKIREMNEKAKDKLINGDSIVELENLQDASIDIVVTDPPYGMSYKSNSGQFSSQVTKQGVESDTLDEALPLFDTICEILSRKTKEQAHLYFFINWNNFHLFREIAAKYFTVKTPVIWHKTEGGMGDIKGDWINGTEIAIFCSKGEKPVNKRRSNVINVPRVPAGQMIHATEKPVNLISEILEVSANKYDIFCDPFMGSGSHIIAAKKAGCNYIGIEKMKDIYDKAIINIKSNTNE